MYNPDGILKSVLGTSTHVIELFVRSSLVDVAPTDTETLGHACAGPAAQMHAAASTRTLRIFRPEDRQALERVPRLADTLHEELAIWDLGSLRGRLAARRRGVKRTPSVVRGEGKPQSLSEFEREVRELLRPRETVTGA